MMMVKTSITAALLSVAVIANQSQAFVPPRTTSIAIEGHASSHETCLLNQRRNDDDNGGAILSNQRRRVLQSTAALALAGFSSLPAFADEVAEAVAAPPVVVPMKSFVDNAKPSLFSLDVPQRFFSIRRSAKGDLPDAKTGQGRRGGTIFTAGDMSKAE
eukprot:scaffold9182_cov99-Skeletonema_dohrnii-CCMP3373.AAC.2